jgi:hypothetical protein
MGSKRNPKDTVLTRSEFCSRSTRLRDRLKKELTETSRPEEVWANCYIGLEIGLESQEGAPRAGLDKSSFDLCGSYAGGSGFNLSRSLSLRANAQK